MYGGVLNRQTQIVEKGTDKTEDSESLLSGHLGLYTVRLVSGLFQLC